MRIERFILGDLESNGYVLSHKDGGKAFIIDPGYNPEVFLKYIEEHNLDLIGIILTHRHSDHVGAVRGILDQISCPVYMHEEDAIYYKGEVDVRLFGGEKLDLEGEVLEIISTPGHTKGSICIMSEKSRVCFTGDTLFDTDLGRTDLKGGSEEDMRKSIIETVSKWDNDITIYPGHDSGCTMKQVRKWNEEYNALLEGGKRNETWD